ncbi:alanine and glycine-rich protein-like [Pipra filicauda]|uniref:Alanine and glycine-rich protein-like n=1 Tax=Pipra filicauda TaxID=649802 RepID=A0A7R5KLH9_9PASS|nr:alanine and glycine-rich protein-like [Pipra filicauda]
MAEGPAPRRPGLAALLPLRSEGHSAPPRCAFAGRGLFNIGSASRAGCRAARARGGGGGAAAENLPGAEASAGLRGAQPEGLRGAARRGEAAEARRGRAAVGSRGGSGGCACAEWGRGGNGPCARRGGAGGAEAGAGPAREGAGLPTPATSVPPGI